MHGRPVRILRAAVAAAVAVAVFLPWIPQSVLVRGSLGRLVIAHTVIPGLTKQKANSQSAAPSQSSFAATRKAGKTHPDQTGLYERAWYVSASAPPEAGVVLQLLPDTKTAAAVMADVRTQVHKQPVLTGLQAQSAESFSLPGFRGAAASSFPLTDGSNPTHPVVSHAYKFAFSVGRVVVTELVVTADASATPRPVIADARAERALLEQREPGFSLTHERFPFVATVLFWVVAAVLVAAAYGGPEWVGRLRVRRHERRLRRIEEQRRRELASRGRRTVRRQSAPSWARTRRAAAGRRR